MIFHQVLQMVVATAQSIAIGALCGSAIELIFRGESQSLVSRVRGIGFHLCYLAIGSVLFWTAYFAIADLGYHPLVTINLAGLSSSGSLPVRLFGYSIAPFLAVLWGEVLYYWFHRLQHAVPVLWRLHATHHAITELNVMNAYHHVSEELLRIPIVFLPTLFVMQVQAPQVTAITYFIMIGGALAHGNSRISYGPLRYLWGEPRYHRVHHSIEPRHWNKNFSTNFPIIDLVFGTAYVPGPDEFPRTGVVGRSESRSLREFLFPPAMPRASGLQVATTSPGGSVLARAAMLGRHRRHR